MQEQLTFKRTANDEQQNAIFHSGGKLLSAGAGSGKTFVLIEHMIHLLSEIKLNTSSTDWNRAISTKLSSIVLMTFTKKAAGEMSVRMMKKVQELIEDSEVQSQLDDLQFWNLVRQNLSSFNITTIHGFCHRVLRMGFWTEFPQNINLVSSIEHKNKIQKLFDKWFSEKNKDLDPLFLSNSQSLLTAMEEIFSSPELRVLWKSPANLIDAKTEINRFLIQFIEVCGYQQLWNTPIDMSCPEKEKNKKWYEFLVQLNQVVTENGIITAENFIKYNDFFKSIVRFPVTNSKEISPSQKIVFDITRNLKDDFKKLFDDFEALINFFDVFKNWVSTIEEVFNSVEHSYLEVDGITFSDLEYYVLQALKHPDVSKKIHESFTYFIVDEFQDTSVVQFEILKLLTNNDPHKLFCVGDRKQAIYGFRGGELQVFADCSNRVGPQNNYLLRNNFRSAKAVIEFNNHLFAKVFPLGIGYEGHDPHGVEMEEQNVPDRDKDNLGSVVTIKTEVVNYTDVVDLDQIEAKVLAQHIITILKDDSYQSICVLYRKLRPSRYLLEQLLELDAAFSAQVKIQYSDDPLINLFLFSIELYLNRNHEKKKASTMLLFETLLSVLSVKVSCTQPLNQFFSDLNLIGLRLAFHKMVFSLGLSNSQHSQNAELIDAICKLTKENLISTYHLLKNGDGEDYSTEIISTPANKLNNKRVLIMSAHASKGLEFDAVLLAGVHSNGRYNGMKDHIGKYPHSFKWKKSFNQKKFFKSPFYHLESTLLSLKDFSESKRLLYVACTRAVKHLAFVDLWGIVKDKLTPLHNYDNSWIHALRIEEASIIEQKVESLNIKKNEISLMQKDSLGLMASGLRSLGLISELSVTRLAIIADCPFKFYLSNICKIEIDHANSFLQDSDVESGDEEAFYSSKNRGTEIHSILSNLFLKQITVDQVTTKEKGKVEWAFTEAKNFLENNYEVISERMIKFSFFGQMISGTPDLIFFNKNSDLVVWDFKTGMRNEKQEASYWFQLLSYAYAYGNLKNFTKDKKISLSLLYLDQKQNITKIYSLDEITQLLFISWKKTESLDQVNLEHCSHCEYSTICHKGKSSP